jgi:predicted Zn-dependent protease with MMP-like domain
MSLSGTEREAFDRLLEELVGGLPAYLRELMEEVPLVVEDEPGDERKAELAMGAGEDLLGLHWGTPLTERSVSAPWDLPDRMMLFRGPIRRAAGGGGRPSEPALRQQIRITLLHEMGHHFGLDEDQLAELGYD